MTEVDAMTAIAMAAQPAAEYCMFMVQWWPFCLTKSEWAAWVQAGGSLVALGIAIWLPARQRLHEAKLRRDAEEARAHVVGAGVLSLLPHIGGALESALIEIAESRSKNTFPVSDLNRLLVKLEVPSEDQILALQPVDHQLAVSLAQMRTFISRAISLLAVHSGMTVETKKIEPALDLLNEMLRGATDILEGSYERLERFLGGFKITDR